MQVLRVAALCVVTALPLVACTDDPVASPLSAAAGGNAQTSTSGGGLIDLTTAAAGFASFSFNATDHGNGNTTGTFRQSREAGGLTVDFSGTVTCVSVDGATGRAWIGGVVSANNSTHPAFQTDIHQPGQDVWFRVVDYGEGSKASQADRSTVFGFRGAAGIFTSLEYCANRPWPDADARTFPISQGNIQVK
jgi:hypothetical protein